jgi:hypothetical protein
MSDPLISPAWDSHSGVTYPPKPLAILVGLELLLAAVVFFPAERWANWLGYGVAGWAVMLTALLYRHIDRRKRMAAPGRYVSSRSLNRAVMSAVLLGFAIAGFHAWFIALEHRLAA